MVICLAMTMRSALFVAAPLCLLVGCGEHKDEVIDGVVLPDIEFARFLLGVKHTHMHLEPGNTWEYDAVTPAGAEHTSAEVLVERRDFEGPHVEAMALKSSVTLADKPIRESTAWFGQDNTGAVWQFGKDECAYEGATCEPTARSWVWSGGDARPGIVLLADPQVDGQPFFEAYFKGQIEDVAEVVSLGETVTVPGGTFEGCVKVHQTSKLDSSVNRAVHYCPIVGIALVEDGDVKVELTHFGGV